MDERYQRQLAAWHNFMEHGRIDHDQVRPVIAESWKRCREAGLDPKAPKTPVRLTAEEQLALQESNQDFMEVALPFMRFLEAAVRGTGFLLVLTEINGYVLEVFGDDEIMRMAQNKNYVPGCCRTEMEAGTNGISLTLGLQRPIQITGPEHYNVGHHLWTCASAPVFSPVGRCLGSVTLSGESINAHSHTLGMVMSAAEAIGNALRQRQAVREKGRVDSLADQLLKAISETMSAADGRESISHINERLAAILDLQTGPAQGRPAAEPGSGEAGVRGDPSAADTDGEKQHPTVREMEVEALRRALRDFDGNISKVSRQLGLSRSTVYRRMKEHGIKRSVTVG